MEQIKHLLRDAQYGVVRSVNSIEGQTIARAMLDSGKK